MGAHPFPQVQVGEGSDAMKKFLKYCHDPIGKPALKYTYVKKPNDTDRNEGHKDNS